MTLGDAQWERRHGRLSAADRWQYALSGVAARLRDALVNSPFQGRSRGLHRLDLERIVYPDSACAKAALEKVCVLASAALANHSLRTYIWGSLLGMIDGKSWDEEILFVSSMVHDLGLTNVLHGSCVSAQCFTLDGVNGIPDVFAQTTPERAERMRRAVLLHFNASVPGEVHGWEAHYLRAGAVLDVLGQRHAELPEVVVRDTLLKHPRLNFKEESVAWVERESALRPGSRMAVARRLGLSSLVRRAPFDS